MSKLLFPNNEWTVEQLQECYKVLERINKEKYKLDVYNNRIEIITFDQMINLCGTNGLPIIYPHWSFGQNQLQQEELYRKGKSGLAYEIVINTDPAIAYCMETNTGLMQALVIAHASFGHNFVFKNNYLFKNGVKANFILDYMRYARKFITECEEKYGEGIVEDTIDAAHSLKYHSVDLTKRKYIAHQDNSAKWNEKIEDIMSDTSISRRERDIFKRQFLKNIKNSGKAKVPEENILYFIEKNSPHLKQWQREIIRIVRRTTQYFYPQMQTKVVHEGFASFCHYHMIYDLFDEGYLSNSQMMEFIETHTNVLYQPDNLGPTKLNPYTLGFNILMDIKRACQNPDEEDRKWLPSVCGKPWLETIKYIVSNYRDESLIKNFLGPKVINKLELATYHYNPENTKEVEVNNVNSDIKGIRNAVAKDMSIHHNLPNIRVREVRQGKLILEYLASDDLKLHEESERQVLLDVEFLWGNDCIIAR